MEMEVIKVNIQKIFLGLICLIVSHAAFAQSYTQIDSSLGVEVEEYMLADTAGNLITIGIDINGSNIQVKRFVGNRIDTLPLLSIRPGALSNDSLKGIYFQGDLYVLGRFEYKGDSTIRYNGLARLNNGQWESIGLDSLNNYLFSNYYHKPNMFIHGSKLIISGNFDSLGLRAADHMVAWDGNSLSPYEAVAVPANISYITARNDTLFYLSDSLRNNCRITTYFNGIEIFTDTIGYYSHLHDRYDNLYLSRWGDLLKVNGRGYEILPLARPSHLHKGAGALWYTSLSGVNKFINRYSDEVISNLIELDTTFVRGIFGIDSTLYFEIYDPQTPPAQHIYRLMRLDLRDYRSIRGRAYIDLDQTCSYTLGDVPLTNRVISSTDNVYNVATNHRGEYQINFMNSDTLLIDGFVQPNCTLSCNSGNYTILPYGLSSDSSDLIYSINSTTLDYSVTLSGSVARRGVTGILDIHVTNLSVNSDTIALKLQLPQDLTVDSLSHQYTQNGSEYRFDLPSPSILQTESVRLFYYVDPSEYATGDSLQFSAELERVDSNITNNTDTLNTVIIGPYDPNHKISYPSGGMIHPVSEVDYTIEFQNIGSASAINVKVVDTVDTRLPLRYIKITGTSHLSTYSLQVKNNVLIWTFQNINLPDSSSDPQGSKGYISYTAKLTGGFNLPGDQIDNRAYIYFDYEEPVVTNVASIFIEETNAIPILPDDKDLLLKIYPNPFDNSITALNLTNTDDLLELWDIQGRRISSYPIPAGQKIMITTLDLDAGLYFITSTYLGTHKIIKQR